MNKTKISLHMLICKQTLGSNKKTTHLKWSALVLMLRPVVFLVFFCTVRHTLTCTADQRGQLATDNACCSLTHYHTLTCWPLVLDCHVMLSEPAKYKPEPYCCSTVYFGLSHVPNLKFTFHMCYNHSISHLSE